MPVMTQKVTNDPSELTPGWHPAALLAIVDEPTPETWQMYAKSPRMYRWMFYVWSTPETIRTAPGEAQSAVSSQAFTPRGKNPASKSYLWASELLGRIIQPGEAVDLDPLLPLACRVKIERREQYANIVDVERWTEGQAAITQTLAKGAPQAAPAMSPSSGAFPSFTTGVPAPAQPILPGTPAPSRW